MKEKKPSKSMTEQLTDALGGGYEAEGAVVKDDKVVTEDEAKAKKRKLKLRRKKASVPAPMPEPDEVADIPIGIVGTY